MAFSTDDKRPKPTFVGKVQVPRNSGEVHDLLAKIAPNSALVKARTDPGKAESPPAPFPAHALSKNQPSSLPMPPASIAEGFLDENRDVAVSPAAFALSVQNSITAESSKALEEFTRERAAVSEWSSH